MPLSPRDKELLSWRSRLFISIHHLAVVSLITWIALLFVTSQPL